MTRAFVCLFLCVLILSAQSAQSLSLPGSNAPVFLSSNPAYPGPNETVTLTLTSTALDLSRSDITWVVDGRTTQGVGMTTIDISTGPLGSETSVAATAEALDGSSGGVEATIRPAQLDLIWESDSYVPPFYSGRALAGSNATIHLVALPWFKDDAGTVMPSTIDYQWYRDDTLLKNVSGFNRTSVQLPGPPLFGSATYRVEATSFDGEIHASAEVTIAATDPSLSLYENHPLFGILFHRAIQNNSRSPEIEQTVTAVPYFAHIRSLKDPSLEFSWRANGEDLTPDITSPESLTINARGYEGVVKLDITALSLNDIAMHATGVWNIFFGTSETLLNNVFTTH